MRVVHILFGWTLMSLLGTVPTAFVSAEDLSNPACAAKETASAEDYGPCPDLALVCWYYHGPDALPLGGCSGIGCFDMTYFEQARVVAADDEGLFPRTFKAWFADRASTPYTAWTAFPCEVEKSGNKWKLNIPEGLTRCGAGLMTPEAVYYWHLASNPVTGCLAVGACKQMLIYATPAAIPAAE